MTGKWRCVTYIPEVPPILRIDYYKKRAVETAPLCSMRKIVTIIPASAECIKCHQAA